MGINTSDYEKLGAFYLGREFEPGAAEPLGAPVLYDSRDLVTHGVVLGMTGSGKTGLCLALLEEAAIDGVPAIAIDPKGDIAKLALVFPEFRGADFRPWVNEDDARKAGQSPDEFAEAQAAKWRDGLADWGQDPERVRTFRERAAVRVFTPGSTAGFPVSILSSLEAPPAEITGDLELLGDRIETTVSSLLGLIGIDADPIRSREHILLSSVFHRAWVAGESLSLAALVTQVQRPPFTQVGVVDIESFFPERERHGLAMQLNGLLAAPGFAAWLEGDGLDIQRVLYTPDGKPRTAVFSIAHLGDSERMFFVSLLLNQVVAWMRKQTGTSSLRALVYMDEVFGFLPPTANPPSKKPLMTMLKQGRAHGLGVLLATQNPVDLDYKALSNAGTWFLGRLQTERDKARVLDGLAGVAPGQGQAFDRGAVERLLSGLTSRVFLMNNVHEDGPVLFQVRWVMSYLRGPLTRDQIRDLMAPQRAGADSAAAGPAASAAVAATAPAPTVAAASPARPALPKGIDEFFVRLKTPAAADRIVYLPAILGAGEAHIDDRKTGARGIKRAAFFNRLHPGATAVEWSERESLEAGPAAVLRTQEAEGAGFGDLPPLAIQRETYQDYRDHLSEWFYRDAGVQVWHSPTFGLYSGPDEGEADFRARLAFAAREARDERVAELRAKFDAEVAALEKKLARAEEKIEREKAQASAAKLDSVFSVGSAVLGTLLGRKRLGAATVSRGRSAAGRASRAWKEGRDVESAAAAAAGLRQEIEDTQARCQEAVDALARDLDPAAEELEAVPLRPFKKDISVKAVGLAWLPYRKLADSTLEAEF
jgi:hypothetical protein